MTMNRNERRNMEREIEKMNPRQAEILYKLAIMKADILIKDVGLVINDCYFSAMRENGISEKRAKVIIERTEKLIVEEGLKDYKK